MSKHPVVHFEMPYADQARVAEFYKKAFGWEMIVSGPEMGNYVVAHTAETEGNMVTQTGAINGGFFPRSGERSDQYPSVVIAVDDLAAAAEAVKAAGGEVGEPVEIPGVGSYVSFRDTEGNRASMLMPNNG